MASENLSYSLILAYVVLVLMWSQGVMDGAGGRRAEPMYTRSILTLVMKPGLRDRTVKAWRSRRHLSSGFAELIRNSEAISTQGSSLTASNLSYIPVHY